MGKMEKGEKSVLEDLVFLFIENCRRNESWDVKVMGNVQKKITVEST